MTHILRIDEMAIRFKDDIDNIDNIGRTHRENAERDAINAEKRRLQRLEIKKKDAVLKIAKKCEEIMKNCDVQDFFDTYEYLASKKDLNIPLEKFFPIDCYNIENEEQETGDVSFINAYGDNMLRISPTSSGNKDGFIDIIFNYENRDIGKGWETKLTTFLYEDFYRRMAFPIYRTNETIMELVGVNDKGNTILKFDDEEVSVKTIMKALDNIETQLKEFVNYFFAQVEKNIRR